MFFQWQNSNCIFRFEKLKNLKNVKMSKYVGIVSRHHLPNLQLPPFSDPVLRGGRFLVARVLPLCPLPHRLEVVRNVGGRCSDDGYSHYQQV